MLGSVHSYGYNIVLYHGLVPSSKKIIYNGLVPSSKDVRAIVMFHYVTGWPQLHMPGLVHSFGYNIGLYHGHKIIRNELLDVMEEPNQRIDR